MAVLRLALLGTFEARLDSGSAVTFPRKKSEALLAYLALQPGRMIARDKLAALLWGDASDERARHSLRQALVTLRQALPRAAAACLVEERQRRRQPDGGRGGRHAVRSAGDGGQPRSAGTGGGALPRRPARGYERRRAPLRGM